MKELLCYRNNNQALVPKYGGNYESSSTSQGWPHVFISTILLYSIGSHTFCYLLNWHFIFSTSNVILGLPLPLFISSTVQLESTHFFSFAHYLSPLQITKLSPATSRHGLKSLENLRQHNQTNRLVCCLKERGTKEIRNKEEQLGSKKNQEE